MLCLMMQAECYHYLFEAALRLHNMGLDPTDPKHRPLKAAASKAFSNGMTLENGKQEEVSNKRQHVPDPVSTPEVS